MIGWLLRQSRFQVSQRRGLQHSQSRSGGGHPGGTNHGQGYDAKTTGQHSQGRIPRRRMPNPSLTAAGFSLEERKLPSAAVGAVTLPVSAAVDVVTPGGALVDRDEPYTVSKVKRLGKDAGKVVEKLAGKPPQSPGQITAARKLERPRCAL